MSRIRWCLVNGCFSSTSETASVCWWPRSRRLERVWIDLLAPHSSILTSSLKHRDRVNRNSCVCKLHFEEKFFKGEKRHTMAWPTLFTEEEILTRKPTVPVTVSVATKSDHSYAVAGQTKSDHSYAIPEHTNAELVHQERKWSKADEVDTPDLGKLNVNEKTELDFRKPAVSSKDSNPYAEGIPDFDDNDSSSQNWQGSELAKEPVFSWESYVEVVPADDGDAETCLGEKEALEDPTPEISLYCDDDSTPGEATSDKTHEEISEYQCNECREVIVGFRYTCVQCADFDLCAACEARARHAAHYVLRVPGARPYSEIQAVLAAIRQQILSENLFLNAIDDSLQEEIKMELDEVPLDPANEPAPDPDPLPVADPVIERSLDSENSSTESSEDNDSDVDSPPRSNFLTISSDDSDVGSPPRRNDTPEPFKQTDNSHITTLSSDDSDDSCSPRRKRQRIIPSNKTDQKVVVLRPILLPQYQSVPGNTETQTRDSIATTYKKLTRVFTSQLPQKRLLNNPANTSGPHAELLAPDPLTYRPETLKSIHQSKDYNESVRILQMLNRENIEEQLTEGGAHEKTRKLLPDVLKRRSPRKRPCENALLSSEGPTMHRTEDHQRQQKVMELEVPTQNLQENSEHLLNEQPEFSLRLPPGTNEAALIQALQCEVAVWLRRDF